MDRFLTGRQIDEIFNIGRVTRWKLIKDGILPPPVQLGPNGQQRFSEKLIKEVMESAEIIDIYKDTGYPAVAKGPGENLE